MLWLYVGWRVLRRVWLVLLAGAVALVVLAAHPQTELRQAVHGRGLSSTSRAFSSQRGESVQAIVRSVVTAEGRKPSFQRLRT
jgi:hypothetical protein